MGTNCTKEENTDLKLGIVAEKNDEAVPLQSVKNEDNTVETPTVERRNVEIGDENELETTETEEEAAEQMNSDIAKLWEECFDLSEHFDGITKRIRRYNERFWDEYNQGIQAVEDDNWTRFKELLGAVARDLEQISMDEIVYGLQGTVFSKKKSLEGAQVDCSEAENIPFSRYLEVSRDIRQRLAHILVQSFDLFSHSINMPQEVKKNMLIARSSSVWSCVYTLHTGLQEIIEKFLSQVQDDKVSAKLSSTEENKKDIFSVLNLSVSITKRKHLESKPGAGEIIRKVIELRDLLSKEL